MTEEQNYKLTKKDFIPIYGLIKYLNRTMPALTSEDLSFKDNLKMELTQFGLSLYNIGAICVATLALSAAAVGLEELLK